jgi:hypothetical protein
MAAAMILVEIRTDMSKFGSQKNLSTHRKKTIFFITIKNYNLSFSYPSNFDLELMAILKAEQNVNPSLSS